MAGYVGDYQDQRNYAIDQRCISAAVIVDTNDREHRAVDGRV